MTEYVTNSMKITSKSKLLLETPDKMCVQEQPHDRLPLPRFGRDLILCFPTNRSHIKTYLVYDSVPTLSSLSQSLSFPSLIFCLRCSFSLNSFFYKPILNAPHLSALRTWHPNSSCIGKALPFSVNAPRKAPAPRFLNLLKSPLKSHATLAWCSVNAHHPFFWALLCNGNATPNRRQAQNSKPVRGS